MREFGAQHQFTAQARGTDAGACGHIFQTLVLGTHKRVARIFSRAHGSQRKAFGQHHGHVLERVHRQICGPFQHRRFQFLDEQALAADFGERLIENLIALGGHAENFDVQFRVTIAQQSLHVQSLPHSQRAFARSDHAAFQFGHSLSFKLRSDAVRALTPTSANPLFGADSNKATLRAGLREAPRQPTWTKFIA